MSTPPLEDNLFDKLTDNTQGSITDEEIEEEWPQTPQSSPTNTPNGANDSRPG